MAVKVTDYHFQVVIDSLKNGISIMQLCREMFAAGVEFPSASALYTYCYADEQRHELYTRAREQFAHAVADEVIDIADNTVDPQRARNRMNARQWVASKVMPRIYGDKLDLNVDQKINVSVAVTAARERLQRMNGSNQVIDVTPQLPITTTDIKSLAESEIDPFS